ncbi:MAG: hypothetical protein ACM3N0_12440 [Chloroflexota bacterium]
MKRTKTRIAAAATVLGLGGLTGLALSAGGQKANSLADKPIVRTKVIHRTVHVTKHLKPKNPVAAGGGAYGESAGSAGYAPVTTGSSSTGSTPSYGSSPVTTGASSTSAGTSGGGSAPVVTHTSGSAGSGGEASAPVTTSTSGAGGGAAGGGGESESEGGGGD